MRPLRSPAHSWPCAAEPNSSAGAEGTASGSASSSVAEAQSIVDSHLGDPTFVAPPAFDPSGAAGKTVWWLGHKEGVGEQWSNFTQEALESADVKFNFYDIGEGVSDAKIQQGFELAIAGDVDAIVLTGGPSAYAYEAQIKAAKDKGIPVVTLVNSTPDDQPKIDGLFVDVTYDYAAIGELLAAWVVADSGGDANVLSLDYEGVPSSQVELAGFEKELERLAPEAKYTVKPVSYTANVATEGANLVRTSLLADPSINYVVPPFDSMALWAEPGVDAAGKSDEVKLAGFNAIVAQMQNLKTDGRVPGRRRCLERVAVVGRRRQRAPGARGAARGRGPPDRLPALHPRERAGPRRVGGEQSGLVRHRLRRGVRQSLDEVVTVAPQTVHVGPSLPHAATDPGPLPPSLQLSHVSKTFGAVRVLHDVSISIEPGEIRGLVGRNGSGKSTLIKVLAGYHDPDEGAELHVNGEAVALPVKPGEAHRHHIAFVHQDLGLVPEMTILDNLLAGRYPTGPVSRIRWRRQASRARDALRRFGGDADPLARLGQLREVDRALVAITRGFLEIEGAPGVLVLDEPTAFLPRDDVDRLFSAVRDVAAQGTSVVYVSHRLDEVFDLTDSVTVLRDGHLVTTRQTSSLDQDNLIELILGQKLEAFYPAIRAAAGDTVLEAIGLRGDIVTDISFELRAGEIIGITGLTGSGYDEIPYLLFGARGGAGGSVAFDGTTHDVDRLRPDQAIAGGIALLPGDRQR